MKRERYSVLGAIVVSIVAGGASGQILLDGDMEGLSVGSPPDCAMDAGAWGFPEAYVTAGVCETDPENLRIEADPTGPGNSLLMKIADAPGVATNVHLPNIFAEVVPEGAGLATVQFDIYVPSGAAGGAIYVGGDHGGGGFSLATDRGPQLLWNAAGQINGYGPVAAPVTDYAFDVWQQVVLEIDLVSDTFDMYHTNDRSSPPELVASDHGFRSPSLDFLDRFTFAHFGGAEPTNVAFLDNITVSVESVCYPDCDASGTLDFFDFLCFQNAFAAGEPYGDCDESGTHDFFDFLCFQNEFAAGCP